MLVYVKKYEKDTSHRPECVIDIEEGNRSTCHMVDFNRAK